jgi:hypothetical protein
MPSSRAQQCIDAIAEPRPLGERARPLARVAESTRLDEVLREMRPDRRHLALVLDEHGTVVGLASSASPTLGPRSSTASRHELHCATRSWRLKAAAARSAAPNRARARPGRRDAGNGDLDAFQPAFLICGTLGLLAAGGLLLVLRPGRAWYGIQGGVLDELLSENVGSGRSAWRLLERMLAP